MFLIKCFLCANKLVTFQEYMPLPPLDENKEDQPQEEPKLQFSYVECLLFTFHQLARKYPEFLTAEENADRLKDFRIRLQYLARGVQIYIKQLRMALQGKTGDALKTDEVGVIQFFIILKCRDARISDPASDTRPVIAICWISAIRQLKNTRSVRYLKVFKI